MSETDAVKPTAEDRCAELMAMKMGQWPPNLYSYARLLSKKFGAAGGTFELACYNYAVAVEGLSGVTLQIDDDEKALLKCIYTREDRMSSRRKVFDAVALEIDIGEAKIGGRPFASLHEAYAVLLEEVDELKAECWKREGNRSPHQITMEAIQIAAIAVRIAEQFGPKA